MGAVEREWEGEEIEREKWRGGVERRRPRGREEGDSWKGSGKGREGGMERPAIAYVLVCSVIFHCGYGLVHNVSQSYYSCPADQLAVSAITHIYQVSVRCVVAAICVSSIET